MEFIFYITGAIKNNLLCNQSFQVIVILLPQVLFLKVFYTRKKVETVTIDVGKCTITFIRYMVHKKLLKPHKIQLHLLPQCASTYALQTRTRKVPNARHISLFPITGPLSFSLLDNLNRKSCKQHSATRKLYPGTIQCTDIHNSRCCLTGRNFSNFRQGPALNCREVTSSEAGVILTPTTT